MARRKTPPSRLARLQALLGSGLGHVLVRVTIAALVFLLAGLVMRQARAYTYKLDEFRVGSSTLRFTNLPAWSDERVQRAFEPRMFGPFSVSIYDPDAPAILRARVERHPMVREVREVRLLYPNRAEVQPVLRVPVARVAVWVQGAEGHQVTRWRLLSDDGCLLPRSPYRAYLKGIPFELPVITGIRERAPLEAGEVWEDRTARVKEGVAAARLAGRLFRDLSGRVTVTRIDVSRFPATSENRDGGEVRIYLSCPPERRGGPRVERVVEWGRTERARAEVPWEDDYPTKLHRLRIALTAPAPSTQIDVRWPQGGSGRTTP
jgi:hypothetical protein